MKLMKDRTFRDIDYWTTELSKTVVAIGPIKNKISEIPFQPLTYEEQFKLRELLMDYQSYTNLLRETVNDAKREKFTFLDRIKNLFNK